MDYRIEDKEKLILLGHCIKCTGSPTNPDNTYEKTKNHWLTYKDAIRKLKALRDNQPVWYDVYTDFKCEEFSHFIAVESLTICSSEEFVKVEIPAHQYAVFETSCCESPEEEWITFMKRIASEWLPLSGYKIAEQPQINKLFFGDNYSERYIEIWIPIEKK